MKLLNPGKKLIYLMCCFQSMISYAQCLSGPYTIGGIAPDYTSITSAVSALTTYGVCGPVVFNIRTGTYAEQVSIPQVMGSSAINTITFQSEALDSTSVIIQSTSTSTLNYVMRLNGADYIRLHKVQLKNITTGTGLYACVLSIGNNADYNEVSNCILDGPLTTVDTEDRSILRMTSYENENYTIKNNVFKGGSYGIRTSVVASNPLPFIVENNTFLNQCTTMIILGGIKSPRINGNIITGNMLKSSSIYLVNCNDSMEVINNQINLLNSVGGITLEKCVGHPLKNILVANNIINVSGTGGGVGFQSTSATVFYHNTLVVNSTTNAACIGESPASDVIVKNNIIYQKGSGVVYNTALNSALKADYNLIYTEAPVFAIRYYVVSASFNDWKSKSKLDSNSVIAKPRFISSLDFHPAGNFSQNMKLPYLSEAGKDKDGAVRDGNSPFPGAYEILNDPALLEASVSRITNNAIQNCVGSAPAKVVLRNFSSVPLTSATINWSINGTLQPPFNWSGNLSYNDSSLVEIGNLNFVKNGTYTFTAWSANPNGQQDSYIFNDSSTAVLYTGLSGAYTVMGTSPDFNSLAVAFSALQLRGACGNVFFNIRSGTYSQFFDLTAIPGLAGNATVTIQSESGINTSVVFLNPNASQNVFKFSGISNLSIKNITLGNASATAPLILFSGSSKNIEINNCIFNAPKLYAIQGNIASGTAPGSAIRIVNNTFNECYYSIYFQNQNSSPKFANLQVKGNTVKALINGTIYINGVDSVELSGNNFKAASLNMRYSKIKNNKFNGDGVTALLLNFGTGNTTVNNMITVYGTNNYTVAAQLQNEVKSIFMNNSLVSFNTNAIASVLAITYDKADSTMGGSKFWNNAIANYGKGMVIGGDVKPSFKNNSYFKKGSTFGRLTRNSVTLDALTLADWERITGSDTNSLTVDPLFVSETDLHVKDISLKRAGTNVSSYLTDDFDGEVRNVNTPDIGADEFTPLLLDVATAGYVFGSILCPGTQPIRIYLKNNGSTTLTAASIQCKINATLLPLYNWTGNLPAGKQELVTLTNYNLLPYTPYTFTTWTSKPNNQTDVLTRNDTSTASFLQTALSGTYTIGGAAPDFTTIMAAVNALKGGICGPVVFNIRNGTYKEKLIIPAIVANPKTATITFQSESLDSSLVTLENSDTDFGVTIDKASYLILNKLGFLAAHATTGNSIRVTTSGSHLEIRNCFFNTIATNGTLINYIGNRADSCLVRNNRFSGGATAVSFGASNNTRVIANYFEKQAIAGITVGGHNLEFKSNVFNYTTGQKAINTLSTTGGEISKNIITFSVKGDAGIYVENLNTSYTVSRLTIANNFVSIIGGAGISITKMKNAAIIHNSVYQTGNGTCLSMVLTDSVINRNNIYYHTFNRNYCVSITDPVTRYHSDFNCIESQNDSLLIVNKKPYTSISAYAAATGEDINSVSTDPFFTSFGNLHITNSPLLKEKATYINYVQDDIDGESRNPKPDIGADEFTVYNLHHDAALQELFFSDPECGGVKTAYVKIKNMGFDTLKTLIITTSYDGVIYPSVSWSGALPRGQEKDSIILGTINNVYGAKHFKAWTESPNGNTDENKSNDTLVKNYTDIKMKGTFTIGGTTPDFIDIRQAATALKNTGLCGEVIFEIRPGLYIDSLTWPLITGSDKYRVTFRSEKRDSTTVVIQNFPLLPKEGYIFQFPSGTRNVTFEMVSFNITPTDSVINAILFEPTSEAVYGIGLLNCSFSFSGPAKVMSRMINLNGTTQYAKGAVKNSLFSGEGTNIYSGSENFYPGSFEISNNLFTGKANNILIWGYHGMIAIHNNRFLPAHKGHRAISLRNTIAVIERNSIKSYYINALDVSNGTYYIKNNYIEMDSVFSKTDCAVRIGETVSPTQVVYNTIRLNAYAECSAIETNSAAVSIKNNIFVHTGNKGFLIVTAIDHETTVDYNRYFTRSPDFGKRDLTGYATFATWKAGSGYDQHSFHKETHFAVSPGYKISGENDLNNAGTPISGITTDIENNLRDTLAPDVGAYEYISNSTEVWPGDTDKDNLVSNNDYLPIGLYYGQTGSTRTIISNSWMPYTSINWGVSQVNGFDCKHADCNGDGKIDANDTLAIQLNFNRSHPVVVPATENFLNAFVPMYFTTIAGTYKAGDWIMADLHIGDITQPVNALYGIALSVPYNSAHVKPGTMTISYSNSWLANSGTTAIKFATDDATAKTLYSAVTRTDHLNGKGYGKIATLKFQAQNTVSATDLDIKVAIHKAINAIGDPVKFISLPLKIELPTDLKEEETSAAIRIYPNPFNSGTTISYKLAQKSAVRIEVINALGQYVKTLVYKDQLPCEYSYRFETDEGNRQAGVYFVKIRINEKTKVEKIIAF